MHATASTAAARRWLAAVDPDIEHAERWFDNAGVVLLPVGRNWDAVRIDGPLAEAVLAAGIDGPVTRDHEAHYFLVPPGTARTWNAPGTEAFGLACYVAVPTPERTTGPGVHWVQPPDGSGLLVDADRLAALVKAVYGEAGL